MRKPTGLKRLLILLTLLTLLLAVALPLVTAQEGGGETDTAQVAEDAGGGPLQALGINLGFLIAQVINFAIIALALTAALWNPAVNMLDSRSQKIQKGLEDAAAAARARQNAEAEADKILAEARVERQRMLEEARQQGEDVKKGIESEARQEAERIRVEANAEAEATKSAALADLREDVLQISSAVAGRILQDKLDAQKQAKLVSDFFSKVPDSAKNLSGKVEVTSAMPLTDAEQKQVESTIEADSYDYSVDPGILGGLIVRSQDKVVDGSVRGSLNDLTGQLK